MGEATRVVMPQLGESIVEATLVRWRVQAGEAVQRGQVLAEVETDKATNEIPAPAAGVIGEILVAEGTTVPVGTPILAYAGASASPAPPAPAPAPPPKTDAPERLPSRHLAPRPADGRPASPAVRRIAREHGIELAGLSGTGRRGRLTREDLLAAVEQRSAGAPASAPALAKPALYRPPVYRVGPKDQVVPFSRRRKLIAEHMSYSLATAAHVAAIVEMDMGRVLRAREKDKAAAEKSGVKLTVTAYVVEAVARALAEHPALNATVTGEALVLRAEKNIGVAVDTEEGLIVPVIKRADELGITGIARAIQEMTAKAREGHLDAEDLAGGSFTISNPGRDGNLFGISIIRQPEVGILRIGEIVKRAVVRERDGEDAIVIRPIMFAALSYDHRVIDGRTGNAFLHRVKALLEG